MCTTPFVIPEGNLRLPGGRRLLRDDNQASSVTMRPWAWR